MNLSDDSLLAGMAMGDGAAAAAFVRRYQPRVYGLALTIVGSNTVAEEVAQEAFLRIWRSATAYDPRRGRWDPGADDHTQPRHRCAATSR